MRSLSIFELIEYNLLTCEHICKSKEQEVKQEEFNHFCEEKLKFDARNRIQTELRYASGLS
jgi:hypothetical protein